jgi:hypothetical protein
MPTKRLVSVSPQDLRPTVLATFRLRGDVVDIEEHVARIIPLMGLDQLVDPGFDLDRDFEGDLSASNDDDGDDDSPRTLDASDGLRYWAALDVAFSNSTYCYVETVPDDEAE